MNLNFHRFGFLKFWIFSYLHVIYVEMTGKISPHPFIIAVKRERSSFLEWIVIVRDTGI